MYIIVKTLPFMPKKPFYSASREVDGRTCIYDALGRYFFYGTFNRVRAKKYTTWLHAWFVNLRFKGKIEKIHVQL